MSACIQITTKEEASTYNNTQKALGAEKLVSYKE